MSREDLLSRIEVADKQLREHAAHEKPTGLTEPDPGADERWEAGQVWSHVAEFVPYWHGQIESVIAAYDGTPVPFGRMKTDPDRLAGIALGKTESIAELATQTSELTASVKRFLDGLPPEHWKAVGLHPVRGEMDVEAMARTFLADHLEEHVAQLDGLRA